VIGTPSFERGYPRRIASILGWAFDGCPAFEEERNYDENYGYGAS
jgi:hypothetical protein